jgi:16S rRNA (uracil1498-N3)-methyltransferase
MQRYFIEPTNWHDDYALLASNNYHHAKTVMRLQEGEQITVCDGLGNGYIAVLSRYAKDSVVARFQTKIAFETLYHHITVAQAMIRRDNFEMMIEKATELGVHAIIPTEFRRSVVRIDPDDVGKKTDRFWLIAKEAAEQSERLVVPTIHDAVKLDKLPLHEFKQTFVASERHVGAISLESALATVDWTKEVLLIVGPEGGIDPSELQDLLRRGAKPISFGKRILRSETASLFFLSIANYLTEGRK